MKVLFLTDEECSELRITSVATLYIIMSGCSQLAKNMRHGECENADENNRALHKEAAREVIWRDLQKKLGMT